MNPDPTHVFLQEATDLLAQIEEVALGLEANPHDTDAIHRLFRAFHTIKGSGAMFGFEAVAAFTHHVETVLDEVRNGRLPVTSELLALLLAARDAIHSLLNEPATPAVGAECERIVQALAALRPAAAAEAATAPAAAPAESGTPEATATWQIRFQPPRTLGATGTDPLGLLAELRTLGTCEITADLSAVPPLEALNPEDCHLSWQIRLTTDRGFNAIKDVFIFVEDESRITIEREPAAATPAVAPATPAAAPVIRPTPAAQPAKDIAPATSARSAARDGIVRVPSAKLDRLVGLVGEFVMNQSRLSQLVLRTSNAEFGAPVEAIERLVDELRECVLGIRMMPIGTTFNRFKRLVHDLSRELGKQIELVTEGAETELDKTVLDQLGDPLVHLIRNSIDHGIESPEERRQSGKPVAGTVRLSAVHAGSHVVITIQDDGRGLDRERIRAKAVERGLIAADATLSDKELVNLIFLPGFSTAQSVTSVSGRGVGMDVVKKQIEALRGAVEIGSGHGAGTTVSLRLPLTLAIIDGLLVELAGDPFILPMAVITENVELARAERGRQNGRNVIAVRGELVPYVRLRELFGLPDDGPDLEKIVIARHEDERVGIVVDRVLGSHQTVIQSLGRFYRGVEVCSGATIMGDGRVALILDVPGLLRQAARQSNDGRRAA